MSKVLCTLRDIVLWFVRDHNGKPSNTRLIMLIITLKAVQWGDYLVYETSEGITDNLLYLLALCVLGTAFFMKMVRPNQLLEGLVAVFTRKPAPRVGVESSGFVSTPQSSDWWRGGLTPEEKNIEHSIEGPRQ